MNKFQLRPRFNLEIPFKPEEVQIKIKEKINKSETKITADIVTGFATLKIPENQQHYWSPELSLQIEEHENGSLIRGLFGPKPSIWTMFASFKALTVFIMIVGLMFGMAQLFLGNMPTGLIATTIGIILFISAYAIAKTGQKLGKDQMIILREFLDDSLN